MPELTCYTLAQLVAIVCPNEEKQAAYKSARRIQNWVTAGLLRPAGLTHGGRGVHRTYDHHEIGKAAVLMELHRYHMPIRVLELVAGLFDDARPIEESQFVSAVRPPSAGQRLKQRKLARLLMQAWRSEGPVHLTMHAESEGDIGAELSTEPAKPKGAPSVIWVDLTAILSAVQSRLPEANTDS